MGKLRKTHDHVTKIIVTIFILNSRRPTVQMRPNLYVIPVSERYKNMNDHWRYFVKKVEMDLEIMHEKYFFFLFSFEILAWKFFGTTKHPP